jgi:hypothetical protein
MICKLLLKYFKFNLKGYYDRNIKSKMKEKEIDMSLKEDVVNEEIRLPLTILGCKSHISTQVISVLIILDSFLFFVQTFFRWGAPCFLWWNHVSTTITFLIGHTTRIISLPISIFAIKSIKKEQIDGISYLFYYLLVASFLSLLDLGFSSIEVHDVCHSDEIKEWNSCSHGWGKQEYKCIIDDENLYCNVNLIYNDFERDKQICSANTNCSYVKNTDYIKPECCSDPTWKYHNPCNEDPIITETPFDTSWCEKFSDIYDVGIQLATTLVLLGFSYVVHFHKKILIEDQNENFISNPFEEYSDSDNED